jgi:hypothetical protein
MSIINKIFVVLQLAIVRNWYTKTTAIDPIKLKRKENGTNTYVTASINPMSIKTPESNI